MLSLCQLIFVRILYSYQCIFFQHFFITSSAALYKNLVFTKFMMLSTMFYFFLFKMAEICCLPHETHFNDVWYKRSWVLMVQALLPCDNDLLFKMFLNYTKCGIYCCLSCVSQADLAAEMWWNDHIKLVHVSEFVILFCSPLWNFLLTLLQFKYDLAYCPSFERKHVWETWCKCATIGHSMFVFFKFHVGIKMVNVYTCKWCGGDAIAA